VFLIGLAQLVAGVLLTVFTAGTMVEVGNALIFEGVSDMVTGVTSLINNEFSWKKWAIEKAISVVMTLITMGASAYFESSTRVA
jgi:hypothetical protein